MARQLAAAIPGSTISGAHSTETVRWYRDDTETSSENLHVHTGHDGAPYVSIGADGMGARMALRIARLIGRSPGHAEPALPDRPSR